MQKLGKLSDNESAGATPLRGSYRVTLDVDFGVTTSTTLASLDASLKALGATDVCVEKYKSAIKFLTGEAVELTADFTCKKPIWADAYQNLVISDELTDSNSHSVGSFEVAIPKGIIAEVNKSSSEDEVELLFTGSTIDLVDKTAYLGVIRVPAVFVKKCI